MIVRALDINGDWTFGKGKNNYRRNKDAFDQNIVTKLKMWKRDCFFALQEGVDYNNLLDVGKKNLLDLDIKRVIFITENLLKIDRFESELDRDERAYSVSTDIISIYGLSKINI